MHKHSTKTLFFGTAVLALAGAVMFFLTGYTQTPTQDTESIIYESPAESASECSTFEKYDNTSKTCYFECDQESECVQILESIEKELATWTDTYANAKRGDEDPGADYEKYTRASYSVSPDERISLVSGTDEGEYRSIWDRIGQLSPNNISDRYISEFQIFDNPEDDTQAFVDDPDGDGRWRIAVNLSGYRASVPNERYSTLIHELGHIITLNTSQVEPRVDPCSTYATDEGCAKANSYLYLFTSQFWKKGEQVAYDPTKYVTEYAATSDVEDLAESFAFYVLEKDSAGTDVKDQKLNFFAAHPDLVSIRSQMRKVLTRDIIRARKKT